MKKNILLIFCFSILMISCSKEDEMIIKSTSANSESITSKTQVILNVVDSEFNFKPGYTIMMFREEPISNTPLPTLNSPLPTIEKQVISNSEGIAIFELDDYIITPTKLHFEAFIKDGDNYHWKSISHLKFTISKGTKRTTSMLVK